MFGSLRSLGSLLGVRDYSRLLERATRLKETEGSEAALACLSAVLRDGAEDEARRLDIEYAPCRIFMAGCQVECGVRNQDVDEILAGMDLLLRVETLFRSYLGMRSGAWPEVLGVVESALGAVLAPEWGGGIDKSSFRRVVRSAMTAWCNLREPERALRVGARGLGAFPGDAGILMGLAEAYAGKGDPARCLEYFRASISSRAVPESPAAALVLLETIERAGSSGQAHEALGLKGDVLRHVGRWEQAYQAYAQAEADRPGALGPSAAEGLLLAALRKRNFPEVEHFGGRYAPAGFGAEGMTAVEGALAEALQGYPERKRLWILAAQLNLRLGRPDVALHAFTRALSIDAGLADEAISAWRAVPAGAAVGAASRLGLARALVGAGAFDRAVEELGGLETSSTEPADLEAATELCRELVEAAPRHRAGRELLVRLRTRQGALDEALADGRAVLEEAGDAEMAAALSWKVGGAAHALGNSAVNLAARELEIDAWLKAGCEIEALEALEVLGEHPIATEATFGAAIGILRRLASRPGLAPRVRLLTGRFLRRLGLDGEAAAEFLGVLELANPPPGILAAAGAGLQEVLDAVPRREPALENLARVWLGLGRVADARGPLLEVLGARKSDPAVLLEALRRQLAAQPASDEWIECGVAALLAAGGEAHLAESVDLLRRWFELRPGHAAAIAVLCSRVAGEADTEETRRGALVLRARASARAGDDEDLANLCRWLTDTRPAWWAEVADALEADPADSVRHRAAELRSAFLPLPALPEEVAALPADAGIESSPAGPEASAADAEVPREAAMDVVPSERAEEDAAAPVVPAAPAVGEEAGPSRPVRSGSRSARARAALAESVWEEAPALPREAVSVPRPVIVAVGEAGSRGEEGDQPPSGAAPPVLPPVRPGGSRSSRAREALLAARVDFEPVVPTPIPASAPSGVFPVPTEELRGSVAFPGRLGTAGGAGRVADGEFSELLEGAIEAFRRKDYAQARVLFDRAAELRPDDGRVRYNLNLLTKRFSGKSSA
jgi:tetratricopeptide (TPR) repeat protein